MKLICSKANLRKAIKADIWISIVQESESYRQRENHNKRNSKQQDTRQRCKMVFQISETEMQGKIQRKHLG